MSAEDVTIIGAGPAGLAAALQLRRFGIDPLVLEGECIGGLLWNANRVENYPGFPAGVSGPRLVRLFEAQARRASLRVSYEEVAEVAGASGVFQVHTRRRVYRSRVLVIASGTRPIPFGDDQIPARLRDRVYYEVRPLLETRGRRLVIVGAGDAAFDYALNLARRNEVTIVNRGERLRCLPLLWERARADARIAYRPRTRIAGIDALPGGGLRLDCETPDGRLRVEADFLIGALGREPRLDFLSAAVERNLDEQEARGGLYRIGDVKNGIFRQTAIAVGDGILAAMKIHRHLKERLP